MLERLRSQLGAARTGIIVEGVIATAGGALIIAVTQGGGTTITCDRNAATSSELTTQVAAATAGQTVCLTANIDYGAWTGTNKAITVAAADGANPKISLNLGSGDTGFTIDGNHRQWNDTTGLTITGANFFGGTTGPTNITIKDSYFVGTASANPDDDGACTVGGAVQSNGCIEVTLDPAMTPRNVLIQHNVFKNINAHRHNNGDPSCETWPVTATEANIHMTNEGNSGYTFDKNLLLDTTADGFKIGGNATITNNMIVNDKPPINPDPECRHTDDMQLFSGRGSHIRGNWLKGGCLEGIDGFDGMGIITIEHNIVTTCNAHHITLLGQDVAHGDVRFNTIAAGTAPNERIECGAKTGDPTSILSMYNNVARRISLDGGNGGGCSPTRNDHNLCDTACGNGTSQLTGTPVFVGGSDVSLWDTMEDACLAPGSPGITGADDGGQVGLCGGDWNPATDGPPEGEGY